MSVGFGPKWLWAKLTGELFIMVGAIGGIGVVTAPGNVGAIGAFAGVAGIGTAGGTVQASFTLDISEAGKAALTAEIEFGPGPVSPQTPTHGIPLVPLTPTTDTIDLSTLLLAINGANAGSLISPDAGNIQNQLLATLLVAILLNQLVKGSVVV